MTTSRKPSHIHTHTHLLNEKKHWGLKMPSFRLLLSLPLIILLSTFQYIIPSCSPPIFHHYSSALLLKVQYIIMSCSRDKGWLVNDFLSRCPWLSCPVLSSSRLFCKVSAPNFSSLYEVRQSVAKPAWTLFVSFWIPVFQQGHTKHCRKDVWHCDGWLNEWHSANQ